MLLNKFTTTELYDAGVFGPYKMSKVAIALTKLGRGTVTRQNVAYWRKTQPGPTAADKAKDYLKIIVIADTQNKPTEDLDYMRWIGLYIADKKPDVVVHIGDNWDFPSLSMYDKGKKSFEGRRLVEDIAVGSKGMRVLTDAITSKGHTPRLVFCMGNHEERIDRLAENIPELSGFVGTELLPLNELGWEVAPFLQPIEIGGIYFVHFLANPMSGKPYGGGALNQLQKVGKSFVVGHAQKLDIAIRNTLDGTQQIGIVNGACYPFNERYKGPQGNAHFRGITVLHEVHKGSAVPMFVSLDYLERKYGRVV